MRRSHLFPSLLILAIFGAQLVVTCAGVVTKSQGHAFDDVYWPFMDYPMYSEAYGPPVQTSTVQLTAVLGDGRRINVDAAYMGLDFFGWRYHIVERLVAPEPTGEYAYLKEQVEAERQEAIVRALEQVETIMGRRVWELVIDRRVYIIEGGALVEHDQTQKLEFEEEAAVVVSTDDEKEATGEELQ